MKSIWNKRISYQKGKGSSSDNGKRNQGMIEGYFFCIPNPKRQQDQWQEMVWKGNKKALAQDSSNDGMVHLGRE